MPRWFPFFGARDVAAAQPPRDTPLASARYVVLDTELTSLDSRSNRVLSIGAIAMDGGAIRLGQQFYRVLNPGVPIPAPGVLIHGLRPSDVEEGEPVDRVLEDLRTFAGDALLVGHFASIDLKALQKELGKERRLRNPTICTARVHRWLVRREPGTDDMVHQIENADLESLAKIYGLTLQDAHHALADAYLTAQLWQRQLTKLLAHGVRNVGELLKIAAI